MKPTLKFACSLYDRTLPLALGEVAVEGVDLHYVHDLDPRSIFDRMARLEFDAGEMSLSEYICGIARGDERFVGIPVFPSRVFRHGYVCVNQHAGIREPGDLAGKRIGVPLYTMTAAVYIRGLLREEYGVDFSGVQWMQGAVNGAGSHGDPAAPPLLEPVRLLQNDTGRSLSELLDAGAIDAYLGSRLPDSLDRGNVVRLFPDFRAVERDYLARTGVFPIMHLVVIRRDVLARHPFVARSLFDAFEAARRVSWERLQDTGTLACMLPWMRQDVEEMKRLFPGGDAWPNGIEPNRRALDTVLRYLSGERMIARPMTVDELFPPP